MAEAKAEAKAEMVAVEKDQDAVHHRIQDQVEIGRPRPVIRLAEDGATQLLKGNKQ